MKKQILRYGAIAMATAGLAVGVAAASSIDTTGPDSTNKVEVSSYNKAELKNKNNLNVNNNNSQSADTGDAKVKGNTTGGDAMSGDAENSNEADTSVEVDNGACGCIADFFGGSGDLGGGSISTTGPDSYNKIEVKSTNKLEVRNYNNVNVNNNNSQSASTGNATVYHNTTGGDAVSGSASNTNSTSTSVSISN